MSRLGTGSQVLTSMNLHFEMDGHTGLAFGDVLTDELAEDVVWPDCYLRR